MKLLSLILLLTSSFALHARAQNRCLTTQQSADLIKSIDSPATLGPSSENKPFRSALLEMQKDHDKLSKSVLEDTSKNPSRVLELNKLGEANLVRTCEMLRQYGWPSVESVMDDGFAAFLYLVQNSRAVDMQRELVPVLVEAAKKGSVPKPVIADIVDTIRVNSGQPQVFGTQATKRNGVIYILPLLNNQKVDGWRKQYDLPPLADQIRAVETRFKAPVLYSQKMSGHGTAKSAGDMSELGISEGDGDIKVETKLVNLNIRVFAHNLKSPRGVTLTKEDFTIIEDGVEQEPQFFSTESAPFDLVLLLDFSSSTKDKRSLIKKAAKRFVEVTRPDDRVSVIAFADDIKTISDFTTDKPALFKAIDGIKNDGGSAVWDSLKYAYEKIKAAKSPGRRSAIVFMTDGDDSTRSTFADAIEVVRNGDTTLFSVFVNPFTAAPNNGIWLPNQKNILYSPFLSELQLKLSMLADQTGGQFYKANNLEDLNGIYEQVVNDIGRIYTISYEPKNETRDGGWRAVEVKLKGKPDLTARTRLGYYAN